MAECDDAVTVRGRAGYGVLAAFGASGRSRFPGIPSPSRPPTSAGGCYAPAVTPLLRSLTIPVPDGKPRLRGVSHLLGAICACIATVGLLVRHVATPSKALAVLIFGGSLTLLLGTSATYHCINWQPGPRGVLRRLDHAAIFVLIAGGWTPLLLLIPSTMLASADPPRLAGYAPLAAIWAFAVVGITKSMLWPKAPRWITAGLCVTMGWMVIGEAIRRAPLVGTRNFAIIAVAGVTYSLGAVVYAVKWPNPAPATFGYHEVFHALVLVASALLFVHVLGVLAVV